MSVDSRATSRGTTAPLRIEPVTAERWDDLVTLFGDRGACGGCWCMFFRLKGTEFEEGTRRGGSLNRSRLQAIVREDRVPGLLAYRDGDPVGWCSVAPREEFPRISRSPVIRPIDDEAGVWSVVCFYTDRTARGQGGASLLLDAAIEHARKNGARILEAYPIDPGSRSVESEQAYVGLTSMFRRAGFEEVARRREHRPIMRYHF